MLVILFGLSGVGKTYVGQVLSQCKSFFFFDADELLTDEMKECIANKKSFTQEIRDRYFLLLIDKLTLLCSKYKHVVVSQAFYKNKNREQVLAVFPESLFILIESDLKSIMKRIALRQGVVDEEYAKKISSEFEVPKHTYYTVTNELDKNRDYLLAQFMLIPQFKACVLALKSNLTPKLTNNSFWKSNFIALKSLSKSKPDNKTPLNDRENPKHPESTSLFFKSQNGDAGFKNMNLAYKSS
ncbi:MAG: shikimate kinase [bacterium]|nr:shikimate kinase [bacterium]